MSQSGSCCCRVLSARWRKGRVSWPCRPPPPCATSAGRPTARSATTAGRRSAANGAAADARRGGISRTLDRRTCGRLGDGLHQPRRAARGHLGRRRADVAGLPRDRLDRAAQRARLPGARQRPGRRARQVRSPDAGARTARRHGAGRLRTELVRAAACAVRPRLAARDDAGFRLTLTDHWINPCDEYSPPRAPVSWTVTRETLGAGWHTLRGTWDGGRARRADLRRAHARHGDGSVAAAVRALLPAPPDAGRGSRREGDLLPLLPRGRYAASRSGSVFLILTQDRPILANNLCQKRADVAKKIGHTVDV